VIVDRWGYTWNRGGLVLTDAQDVGKHGQSANLTGTLNGVALQFVGEVDLGSGETGVALYGENASRINAPTALTDAVNVSETEVAT
jgi:hypothetical protein